MASSPIYTKDNANSVTVYLVKSSDGSPATGLTYSDITVDLKKAGSSSFTSKTLTASDVTDLGSGFYEIVLSASDLDTIGNLYIRITGSSIVTVLISAFVAESTPTSSSSTLAINRTPLFGYLFDASGNPLSGRSVIARILSVPAILHNNSEGLALGESSITEKTDKDGFFSIELVTGSTVDVFIPEANYRRTLTVPSSSQNIFDIP